MKKTKRFLALVLCLCMILGLPSLSNIFDGISFETTAEAAAGDVYLKSVERDTENNKKLILNFSDEVSINPSLNAYIAVRLLDNMADQNLMWGNDGNWTTVDSKEPLQWTGQLSAYEGDATKLVYTMTDDYDIDHAVALVGEGGIYEGLYVCFCLQDSTGTVNNGVCEGILDKNGNGVKATMSRTWTDQLYMPIAEKYVPEGTTLEWVKVTSDTTLELKFSGAVTLTGGTQPWNAIRILNNMEDQILADSSGNNCQWDGDLSAHPTDNTKLVWTLKEGHNTTISNLLKKVEAGNDWPGYVVTWGIEDGTGTRWDNRCDFIKGEDGKGVICTIQRNHAEQLYSKLIPDVEVTGVTQVDTKTLTITFSDVVSLNDARKFVSLRVVKDINNATWTTAGEGNPAGFGASDPAQWEGTLSDNVAGDNTLTWTINGDYSIDTIKSYFGEGAYWQGSHLCWSIECYGGIDGKVDAINDKAGYYVNSTIGSSIYYSIAYTRSNGEYFQSAVQHNANKLYFTFENPITNVGAGGYIVVVNEDMSIVTAEDGTRLLWIANADAVVSSVSLSAVMTPGVLDANTIDDIFALVNDEDSDYYGKKVMFALVDGLEYTTSDGFINNYYSSSDSASKVNAPYLLDGRDCAMVELQPKEQFTVVEARIYNDTEVLVEFSENFSNTGKYYSAIRLLDANGNLVWVDGVAQQWPVKFYDYYNGKTLRGQLFMQDDTTLQKYSDIVNYAASLTGVASIQFYVGDEGDDFVQANCLVDDFVGVSGNKLYASAPGGQDGTYAPVKVVDGVTVEKVEAIGETSYRVTFSEEVTNTLYGSSTGYAALRIVNSDQKLMWQNGDEITTAESGTPLQWGGTLSPTTDKSVWIFKTVDYRLDTKNYTKISSLVADGGKYEDYELMFCIEEQINGSNIPTYVDNFTSLDGKKILEATNLNSHGNGSYTAITKAFDNSGVTLETVEAISPTQMVLTFSEDIEIVCSEDKSQPFMAFRFVNPTTGIVVYDSDGHPMQWDGYYEYYRGQQNKILWTMHSGNTYGISNITDLLEGEGLEEFIEQYPFGFVIEEHPGPMTEGFEAGDGVVNNITGADSGTGFYANLPNPGSGYDGYLAEEIVIGYDTTKVEMIRADVESDSSLIVTFSEPVTIEGGPFCAIRYVMDDGYLAWTGEINASTPLQFSGYFEYTEDPCKLRWVLHGGQAFGVENLQDILEYKGELANYKQYTPMLAIEENGEVTPGNGLVENVIDKDGNCLDSTLTTRPGWLDGAYCNIYGKTNFTKVEIVSATAVNDLEIVVKFSEPVKFTGNPWMSIRMVDATTGKLYWDGGEWEKGTPMQWSGSWQWNNDEHTEIRWTINGENTYKVANLTDLFNYAKDLEQFKDNENLSFMFNIEELPEGGIFGNSGHVDNIRSVADDRSRLLATYAGGYDGILYDITVDYDDETYLTYYATAINSRQILVQFNDVVTITGNPFMALRYVDGDNNLMWTEGKENYGCPLQFGGSWEWADDSHTAIIWTMSSGNTYMANSITDVLTYKNGLEMFKGATVKFCIEELTDDNITVHGMDNLVHNVTADGGTRHLYANKMKGYDGAYGWINIDYDMSELALISVESSDDSTLLLTFTEKPDFDDSVDMGIAYLDSAGGYIFDDRGGTLKYRGTWEYANEEGTQVKWTINKDDVSIKDFISFNGDFEQYFGANVKFFIVETNDAQDQSQMYDGLISNVTGREGAIKLSATNISQYDALYKDIETTYEVVYPEITFEPEALEAEVITETIYENDYIWVYIGAGALVVIGAVLGMILGKKASKKKGSEGK